MAWRREASLSEHAIRCMHCRQAEKSAEAVADETERKQKHRVKSARLMSQRNKLASDRIAHLQRHKTMDGEDTIKNREIINAAVSQANDAPSVPVRELN